jgi:chromate transporter
VIAAASFIAIFFLHINFPTIIISTIAIGFLIEKFSNHQNQSSSKKENIAVDESEYYIHKDTITDSKISFKGVGIKVLVFSILWVIPIAGLYAVSNDFRFWWQLTGFFTKAAFVTFGGAYAVLPYVAQYSVANLKWLNHAQMMDGLALGETTPGPLIMVLSFVGFIAGYNQFNHSLLHATVALLATTYYTFLPSFFFILTGAPLVERTHQSPVLKSVLKYITAAVVGVLANLCIILLIAVSYKAIEDHSFQNLHYINLAWVVISVVALQKFKVNMILWIGVSAMVGLVLFLLNIA